MSWNALDEIPLKTRLSVQNSHRTARRLSSVCREMWADFYLAFNISACIIDGFKGGMIKYKARQPWTECGIQGSKILQSWVHTSHTIVPMHFTFMQLTDGFISRDLHRIQGIHSASLCIEPLTEQQEDLDQQPQDNPQHVSIIHFKWNQQERNWFKRLTLTPQKVFSGIMGIKHYKTTLTNGKTLKAPNMKTPITTQPLVQLTWKLTHGCLV